MNIVCFALICYPAYFALSFHSRGVHKMNEGFMAGSVEIVQLWFMQWHKKWFVVFILDGQVDLSHNHKTFAWHDHGTYIVASKSNAHNKHMHQLLICWYEIWWSKVDGVHGYRVQGNQHKHGYTKNVSSLEKHKELLTLSAVSFPDYGAASMCKYKYNFENASTKLAQEELPGLTQVFVDGWPSCVLMGKPPY